MTLESAAICHWQGRSSEGRAWLDGGHLLFRGNFRMELTLAEVRSAVAGNGRLSLTTAGGTAALDLGAPASQWAEHIRSRRG